LMHDRSASVSAFSRKSGLHRAGGGVPHVRQHVRVGVKREANIGVPQELPDELGVHALPQQERGAGVA
jgi:hypothetical protein